MILYTDIDPFCCAVLEARAADGGLLPGQVWCRDIATLTAAELKPFNQVHLFAGIGASPLGFKWAGWPADWSLVTGGFPCQPVSVAGKGLAQDDARWLWPEMHRVIDIVRPDWVFAENVPGLRTRGVDLVLDDLERSDYRCWALVVGADDVGAPHRRKRVWIVGLADAHVQAGRRLDTGRRKQQPTRGQVAGSFPNPIGTGRRARRGIAGDKGQPGLERGELAGGVQLADTGLRGVTEWTRAAGRQAEQREPEREAVGSDGGNGRGPRRSSDGVFQEHAVSPGREERHAPAFANQPRLRGWPMPPGPRQHDWEAARLVESGVGVATDGRSRRLAGFARRSALKALGNAQVPQCVEAIARAVIQATTDAPPG